MGKKIRWGIIGTGKIAGQCAKGLACLPDAELVAVGSRAQETADRFGDEYDVARRHSSYEALADDPDVDVVYIATPHPFHKQNSLLCLENGKAVMCEKPFAINAKEAEEVIEFARGKGLFLMEAMWTRFMPLMVKFREVLASGTIGEVRMVEADFGFRSELKPEQRLFNPELGGGALLDVGVYPVSLASMILGPPSEVVSLAHLGETGVDEQSAYILKHPGGQLAVLYAAARTQTGQEATIMGTEGRIKIHERWWCPAKMTVTLAGKKDEVVEIPYECNGYQYESEEVMRCLRESKTESSVMPLDETISIMKTMDLIRSQWPLKYPME